MNIKHKGALLGALGAVFLSAWTIRAASNIPAPTPTPAPAPAAAAATNSDPVVAKGKDVEIKRSTLDEAVLELKTRYAAEGKVISDKFNDYVQWDVLKQIIFKKAILARATEADKAKGKAESVKYMDELHKRYPNTNDLASRIKASGSTLQAFEQDILENSICTAIIEREITVDVPESAIKKLYDENIAKFERPEQVRVSHILIATMDVNQTPLPADKKKEKEKLARSIKERLTKGEDFAKLAKEYSDDPGSKDEGGAMDPISKGETVAEFEAAAFTLKTNQISDLVETRYGYHIIKLHEKIPASTDSLATATPKIKQYLSDQEMKKRLPEYQTRVVKESGIEVIGIKEPPPLPSITDDDDATPMEASDVKAAATTNKPAVAPVTNAPAATTTPAKK